jgi:hypothetical protein
MTTALTPTYATPQSYTVASSLAAANYDITNTTGYNNTTNKPVDVLVEYVATVAASSTGNKQIVLFVQGSLDGTNWPPMPTSATDTTHDTSMIQLGTIPTNGGASSETVRPPKPFSVAAAFNYMMPPYWRLFVKNDCGVALSSCSARTQELGLTAV